MEFHSVVGDRAASQHLPLSLSHVHKHTHTHTSADTHIYTNKCTPLLINNMTQSYMCTGTHTCLIVFGCFSQSLLSLSRSYFFFSLGFAEILCSFNVSPPDRKDLNSPPVHTNKRARILLTACRSALPFMTVG